MEEIAVSIFASAVRIPFYKTFLESLKSTSVPYEVIFCGHNTAAELIKAFEGSGNFTLIRGGDLLPENDQIIETRFHDINFRYLHTRKIKPAQCYEIARRACRGKVSHYTADDCEYSPDLIGKAFRFWEGLNEEKTILSIQTLENGQFCDMRVHSFFGCVPSTPLMAPLGLFSTKLGNEIGGFDRRYVCGQYENDFVMNVMAKDGKVLVFGDKENKIDIDHYRKHGIARPFATGYNHDREILEGSWTVMVNGRSKMSTKILDDIPIGYQRVDEFQPYTKEPNIILESESFKGIWI